MEHSQSPKPNRPVSTYHLFDAHKNVVVSASLEAKQGKRALAEVLRWAIVYAQQLVIIVPDNVEKRVALESLINSLLKKSLDKEGYAPDLELEGIKHPVEELLILPYLERGSTAKVLIATVSEAFEAFFPSKPVKFWTNVPWPWPGGVLITFGFDQCETALESAKFERILTVMRPLMTHHWREAMFVDNVSNIDDLARWTKAVALDFTKSDQPKHRVSSALNDVDVLAMILLSDVIASEYTGVPVVIDGTVLEREIPHIEGEQETLWRKRVAEKLPTK